MFRRPLPPAVQDNPVMLLWVFHNIQWDGYEQKRNIFDAADHYIKVICSFVNPEAMRDVNQKEELEKALKDNQYPSEPKPNSAYPAAVLASIRRSPHRHALDTVVPGDMDIPNA